MAQAQQIPEIQAYRTAITGLYLENVPVGPDKVCLLCDVSLGLPRPIVPPSWRRKVFDIIHGLSHPAIRTTRQLMRQKYVWHGLHENVGLWSKQCVKCQTAKVQTHTKAPLATYPLAHQRFAHVNIDIVGPLPQSQGHRYLLTMVDRFTRWPEAIPMPDATVKTCARAFLFNWVARFGVPADISTDRGPQFTEHLWDTLVHLLGVRLHRTCAYHPQANGLVERFHRHLKSALMARLKDFNWVDALPCVLLGIRSTPKEDLKCSSAELVNGTPLKVPGDAFFPSTSTSSTDNLFLPWLKEKIADYRPQQISRHSKNVVSVPKSLLTCNFVFVRRDTHQPPLAPPYDGPFRVLERGEKFFILDIGGRRDSVSVDRLKPAYIDSNEQLPVTMPRKRGRPKKV